ncbi:MAG: PD-(D/E)XK nuclease family protein [bacterium]|nr:PD-(D/E)XK nuclease family protein [bacterium]
MLKTFELCPKKFEFQYVKNISMPVDDEVFETGKNIHALASYFLQKEDISNMEMSLSDKEKQLWEYLKNIKYFTYKTVATEYNLTVKIGEQFFGGRLDALVENEEHLYILDYKTGSAPKNAKYDYQTMIYLLAVSEFYKTNDINFVYIDLKNKDEVCVDLKTESKEKLLNDIKKNQFK